MKNCPKRYDAQALAISMVVLVVCAILGISIYSRVVKDRALVLNEKVSAEALEIADSVLDSVSTIPVSTLKEKMEEEEDGVVEVKGWSNVNTFLESLGLTSSILDLDVCPQNISTVDLLVEDATPENFIETRPNEARAFIVAQKTIADPCTLRIHTDPRGTVNSGLMLKKIYGKNYSTTPEYKIYDGDDIQAYCFSDDMSDCNSSTFSPDENWVKMDEGGYLDINLNETAAGYLLDEVRVIPVGGVVGISTELLPEGCMQDDNLGAIRIVANVTCQDVYRAKEVFVPEDSSTSFSSFFDHTVYNNIGLLVL